MDPRQSTWAAGEYFPLNCLKCFNAANTFSFYLYPQFKAIVSSSSIFDLRTFSLQSDIPVDKRHFGSSPLFWENVEGFEQYNPARPDLLPNWKTPMLVVHGTKDFRCSVTEGLGAFHTLQALGTPSRLLLFVGHGHSSYYGRAQNWLEYHRQVFAWLNKFTGITDEAELSLKIPMMPQIDKNRHLTIY